MGIPDREREGWIDGVFALGELPEDSEALPRGCVPYLPCALDTLLRMIELAEVRSDDVFVDIGSGLGRVITLVHLLTGASAVGVEIQPDLVRSARALARRLDTPRVHTIEGDAAALTRDDLATGTVFFLYCPFGGDRLDRVLDGIETSASTRTLRICSVDLPLPERPWLDLVSRSDELAIYRTRT